MADQESPQYPGNLGVAGVGGAIPSNVSSPSFDQAFEVIVEVIYRYEPDSVEAFKATIHVYIEAEQSSAKLPYLLRNLNVDLLGARLSSGWGVSKERDGKLYRWEYDYLSANSWGELNEKIERLVEKVKNTLMIVKEENLAALRSKPADFITILKI